MTALLPSSETIERPTIPDAEFGQILTMPMRMRVTTLGKVMRELDKVQRGSRTKAYRAAAPRVGLSFDRTMALHKDWMARGEYALIDHRACKGCGLPGCNNKHQKSHLHPLTVDAWVKLAAENRSNQTNGSRSFDRAWEVLIERICSGADVAGLGHDGEPGTWRDLHMRTLPMDLVPVKCPWSVSLPPPSHGLGNFRRVRPGVVKSADVVAASQGLGKMLAMLPQVQMDWGTARPLEYIFVDDKRLDFHAWVRVDGRIQIVEVWSLFVMDACTRRILWCELKPKIRRADGTTEGISHRDVQHLLTKVLATYGVPTEYKQTWVVENAAAALDHSFDAVLTRATGGQALVKRSGLWDGRVTVGGFIQRGGNPRGKSILESSFGHQLDIALGWIKGQIGTRYQLKPGETDARLQYAQQLAKKMGPISTDAELEGMGFPVESLTKIRGLLLKAFNTIENRRRHQLQGFDKVELWRMDAEDKWRSMNDPRMRQMLARPNGMDLANIILGQPGCTLSRPETKRERWERLFDASKFAALSPAALFDLWLDSASCKYAGTGVFKAKIRKDLTVEFRAKAHPFQIGDMVTMRFDLDNLGEGCALADADGRVMGRGLYEGRIAFGDDEARERSLGFKMHQKAEVLKRVKGLHSSRDVVEAQIREVEGQTELITTIAERAGMLKPAESTSDELVESFAGRSVKRPKKQPAPDADEMAEAELLAAMF